MSHCPSCGAAYFAHESSCAYCKTIRAGFEEEVVEVTTLSDPQTVYIKTGRIVGTVIGAYMGYPQLGAMIGARLSR